MNKKLITQATTKYLSGVLLVSLLLFIPAGTINYFNAWLLMGILFLPIAIVGIILMVKNPGLLEKRLNAKEKEAGQKTVITISSLMFLVGFIIAGLDFRFQWSTIPQWVVTIAAGIFLCSYLLFAAVLWQNEYLSRTIEIQENQHVIDTGLYGVVRHPMYTSTLFLFISMPIVLGSYFSLIIFLIYPAIMIKRINNEETVLEEGLPGYLDYKKQVKYRIIPFIW